MGLHTDWHKLPDFEALGSMRSEVAINPDELFLPESNNKTFVQQEEMVKKFSEEISKKIPGASAIIGEAPDYVELAFAHLDATKDYLFGAINYARTKTQTSSSDVAHVGDFDAAHDLYVGRWLRDDFSGHVRAAPLVVPTGK